MTSEVCTFPSVSSLIEAEQHDGAHGSNRILVVSSGVSGMAVLATRFSQVAASLGFDVSAVVSKPEVVKRRPIRPARARLSLLDQVRHRRRWRRPRYDLDELGQVIAGFSGVLAVGTGPSFPIVPLAAAAGVPIAVMLDVTMNRHAEQNDWPQNRWFRQEVAFESDCFSRADRLLCVSEWARSSVVGDLGIDSDRTLLTPPLLAAADAPELDDRPPPGPVLRFAAIGSPWIRKGMDLTIDWLLHRPDAPVELHLFGDSPGGVTDPRIIEHGRVDGRELIERWLPSMDLLVHPTRRDQSATVVVEAAWAGVASVATAMAGIPELIDDGATGWLVPEGSESALHRTLDEVLEDPDRLRPAGLASRKKAETEFEAHAIFAPVAQWLAGDAAAPIAGNGGRPSAP